MILRIQKVKGWTYWSYSRFRFQSSLKCKSAQDSFYYLKTFQAQVQQHVCYFKYFERCFFYHQFVIITTMNSGSTLICLSLWFFFLLNVWRQCFLSMCGAIGASLRINIRVAVVNNDPPTVSLHCSLVYKRGIVKDCSSFNNYYFTFWIVVYVHTNRKTPHQLQKNPSTLILPIRFVFSRTDKIFQFIVAWKCRSDVVCLCLFRTFFILFVNFGKYLKLR